MQIMLRKMNNRVCGVMLAAMMAAAVSVTACGGQGSTGETVTVQPSEDFVGMPNPFTDNATLEEAEEYSGFSPMAELSQVLGFSVPEVKNIPFEVTSTVYTNGWNEFAQVEYQGKSQDEAVLFRKARGTDDISGDYNTYSDVKEVTVKEVSVTLKGDDGQYKLAIWQQDGFAYSLNYEPGGSEAVFVEMIQSVQ